MKRNFPILTLALAATVFVAGIIYLFLLRFESGDVYPPYSSLRADPLGTMALCESLAKLPGLEVRRDTTDRNELPEEKNTTYLHLAAEVHDWRWLPDELFTEIERFLNRGGRLVITMRPVTGWEFWPGVPPTVPTPPVPIINPNTAGTNAPGAGPVSPKKSSGKNSGAKQFPAMLPNESLAQRWGVDFGREDLRQGDDVYQAAQVNNQTDLPLPDSLDWHSALVLTNLASSWRVIYARGTNVVMAERKFGRGSVVLATDSFFLSNQAMWNEREPRLLAWLIGPAEHVVFDEAHLGVVEASGVAVLMRKYRLTGVIGALVLLAALFIWKNSFSLVPPYAGETRSPYVPGKDATAGFVNLLRRNIPTRQVLEVCFEQWTRSLLNRANYRIAAVDQAQTIMERERARPATARNPVQAYREISEALKNPRLNTPHLTPDTPHPAPKQ
jgi:hypothetical protein